MLSPLPEVGIVPSDELLPIFVFRSRGLLNWKSFIVGADDF